MSFKPLPITFKNSGLIKNKKPFLLMDDAFQKLENAYNWRESIKKREGIKLLGRLRRCYTSDVTLSTQANAASYNNNDLLADPSFALRTHAPDTGQLNAQIEEGSVQITVGTVIFVDPDENGLLTQTGNITGITNANPAVVTSVGHGLTTGTTIDIANVSGMTEVNDIQFTITVLTADTFELDGIDSTLYGVYIGPTGTWTATQATSPSTGNINYSTGELNLNFNPALGGATNVDVQLCYFPCLPVMGIPQRELPAINVEQTLFFDTKYVYTYTSGDFASPSTTTWVGDDSNFFWSTNYRGSEASTRLFFVTNNASPKVDSNNVIRYTSDTSTWTDFTPALSGTQVQTENIGTVTTPWTSFSANVSNTPIIPGSVTVTVSNTSATPADDDVRFKDSITTYPDGTLNGSPPANTGVIEYDTGLINLTNLEGFTEDSSVKVTYQYESSNLYQAKIVIPYYGRLLALNTFEGATAGGSTNFFNRCRFSQVGNPIQQNAWVSTIFGKGGFVDAPTNEAIVSARFYKNTLIVFFERSTWNLRYVGEYGLPFTWERISSDFGSESTFSTLLFDNGILAVGDKAIVSSSGNDVQRIDLDIPDTVFDFHNQDNGKERVHGIRDFQKEIVFWTYSKGGLDKKFPNRTLLFNYRNQTWAIFRDNVTVFGTIASPSGDSWDDPISWDSDTSWNTFFQPELPIVISGNQQGFIHQYQFKLDAESTVDNKIDFRENESLYIKDITRSATDPLNLEIPDHNLEKDEIIYISGLLFVNTSTDTALTTSLNDKFYLISEVVDDDNVELYEYDIDLNDYVTTSGNQIGFSPETGTGTYMGGGVVALLPKLDIITKDFNPITTQKVKSSYTDFQTDATFNSEVSISIYVDSNINPDNTANLPVYDPNMETALNLTGVITNIEIDQPEAGLTRITSADHGLLNGRSVTFSQIKGMTEINGKTGTATYLTNNTFSVDIDSSTFTAYTYGGQWTTNDENAYYVAGSNYAWHRYYSNVHGQYITFQITYSDELMNNPITHTSDFQMNAMTLYVRPSGTLIT